MESSELYLYHLRNFRSIVGLIWMLQLKHRLKRAVKLAQHWTKINPTTSQSEWRRIKTASDWWWNFVIATCI